MAIDALDAMYQEMNSVFSDAVVRDLVRARGNKAKVEEVIGKVANKVVDSLNSKRRELSMAEVK